MIEQITDHEARGVARIIERYRKPLISALVASWLSEVQEVEDALWQLLMMRSVQTGEGETLDVLGRIVSQPREGRDDDTYRIWLSARVLVSRSSGTTTELVAIAQRLANGVLMQLEERYPGAVIMRAHDAVPQVDGNQIAQLLAIAKAGGVSLQFTWFQDPVFKFAPGSTTVLSSPNGFGAGKLAAVSDGTKNVTFA